MQNKQVIINSLPVGKLEESNYKIVESDLPKASSDEVLVKTISFAITAGTRAGLQGSASYAGAPKTGIVMNSTGVGEIIESNNEAFPVGAKVLTMTGWQAYSVQKPEALTLISKMKKVKAILVNLYGGIVKTTIVASAFIKAYDNNLIDLPVYARLMGAEADKSKIMLKDTKTKMFDSVEQAINGVVMEVTKTG